MRILKFGGSSVGTPSNVLKVADIILDTNRGELPKAVVVSAFQGVTNSLLSLAELASKHLPNQINTSKSELNSTISAQLEKLISRHENAFDEVSLASVNLDSQQQSALLEFNLKAKEQFNEWFTNLRYLIQGIALLKECSSRTLDQVASFGECLSALTVTGALIARGVKARFIHAGEIIRTFGPHGHSKVDFRITDQLIAKSLNQDDSILVVTGFIGADKDGIIHTLGRGGSDYTGAILASALNASILEIWTDVDGVLTCDPKRVARAFSLDKLSYQEALELCHFGAKVIYPPTLAPVLAKKIPIKILNTFNPQAKGSYISNEPANLPQAITGISSISDIVLIQVSGSGMVGITGVAKRLFGALAFRDINIILITQASSEHSICVAIKSSEGFTAKQALEEEFRDELNLKQIDPIQLEEELAIVTIVGEQMRKQAGISGKFFSCLGYNNINIRAIAQGSSERSISVVISRNDESKALNALHDDFFDQSNKRSHLVVIGTGLIGQTVLRLVAEHQEQIRSKHGVELKVVGIINSKKQRLNEAGLDTSELLAPKDYLNHGSLDNPLNSNPSSLISSINELSLPRLIVVDCTAEENMFTLYHGLLENHISIVTPNKKIQSGPYESFKALKDLSHSKQVPFLYETSVGAGLPIIGTLQDLIKSGDKVTAIEAVLSGTLSYLFNTFDLSSPFSELVEEARRLGFTEPDPRDDLNGLDVARKILILAREAGDELEIKDVELEGLVPNYAKAAHSVDEFFNLYKKHDKEIEALYKQALSEDKKLRFIARYKSSLENDSKGKITVGLEAVASNHPFYQLSGSDNIVSFTTLRYKERPLVVKGPGAGAEVTAAGILADILRLSKF